MAEPLEAELDAEQQSLEGSQEEEEESEEEFPEVEEDYDEDDLGFCDAAPPTHADPRMRLTEDEHLWALDIRDRIKGDSSLAEMSDFWYAQLAVVCQGDMERALECATGLQAFLQEYELTDCENAEFGTHMMREFMQLLPRFWMAFTFFERDGTYLLVCDSARFYANVLNAKEANVKTWMMATFFMNHAVSPDMEAIRKGAILLVENEGFDWKVNIGVGLYKRLFAELNAYYPLRFQKTKYFSTGLFSNVFLSMAKPFTPTAILDSFDIGCQSGAGRLDEIYLTPTVQEANARFLVSTKAALERRFANEASFSL